MLQTMGGKRRRTHLKEEESGIKECWSLFNK
jgi:hypothetical protein